MNAPNSDLSLDAISAVPANAPPTPPLVAELLDRLVAADKLDAQSMPPAAWLWHGYLGQGKVTLLTSQWKSGKTTLVSLLLSRLRQGGQLAGLPVAAAKALVISEESESDWLPRSRQLEIREHVHLLCRPFTRQPTMDQWLTLLETAAVLHAQHGIKLVVIDSLAHFLPAHSENSASVLVDCLTPLQRLAAAGMCVLLLHHPKKGKTLAGQAARGSGALPGFVDIIMEMSYFTQPDDLDRRRRLVAFSRHDETPRHLLIELNPSGTDYDVVQSGVEAALGDGWTAVEHVLTAATSKLTRQEILANWSPDFQRPDLSTLWRWLSRAVAQGLVRQQGTGRAGDRFRYWLPAREEFMRPDDGSLEALVAWNNRCMAESFASLGIPSAAPPTPPPPRCKSKFPPPPPSTSAAPKQFPGLEPVPCPDPAPALAVKPTSPSKSKIPPPPPSTGAAPKQFPGLEPVPCPNPAPALAAKPTPGALRSPAAQPAQPIAPATPPEPVRLPYPFCLMNPADVPEAVWNQARAARKPIM